MDLQQIGSFKVSQMIPVDFCLYFTHYLLRKKLNAPGGDPQVETAQVVIGYDDVFDTILERLWMHMEKLTGQHLLPTYSYARLYSNGDILHEHVDRPECEVSVTIQLGRSHNYSWPIYIANQRYDLNEGDGIIYNGQVEHRRDICQGPDQYYSGQLFLHYVRADGPYANRAGDNENRLQKGLPMANFDRSRTLLMETK